MAKEDLIPFKKGDDPRRNLEGRPKGSFSPITRVKQIFKEDPEKFEQIVREYMDDKQNRKHLVEMIDGKPKQDFNVEGDVTLKVIVPQAVAEAFNINESNEEAGGSDTEQGEIQSS